MENLASVPPANKLRKLKNSLPAKISFKRSTSTIGTGIWANKRVIAKITKVKISFFFNA